MWGESRLEALFKTWWVGVFFSTLKSRKMGLKQPGRRFLSGTISTIRPGPFLVNILGYFFNVVSSVHSALRMAGCWRVKKKIWSHRFPSEEAYNGTKVTWNPKSLQSKETDIFCCWLELVLTWLPGSFKLMKIVAIFQKWGNQKPKWI